MHQWLLPSVAMNDLGRGFLSDKPAIGLDFSRSMGPDWSSCDGGFLERTVHTELREILAPDGVWKNKPEPSEDLLNDPCFLPLVITIPSGLPSGVKKPALIAARPPWVSAAAAASTQIEAGPLG